MIETEESALHLGSLAPELHDLVLAAAVRERFQPSELLFQWMERHATNVAPDLMDDAMGVALALGAAVGASAETPAGGELPLDLRRVLLGDAGKAAVRRALGLTTPRTEAERSFADLVFGRAPPNPQMMTRADLLALATAAAWSEGLDGAAPLSAAAVETHLRDQEFVESVRGTDLGLFVGRAALLNALCHIWALPERPTVLIEGPGGIGKSIAVARFFQILLSGKRNLPRPDAILHLDFDLPNLQRATEMGLAAEIVRQLALRWTVGPADRLLSLARGLGGDQGNIENARGQISQTFIRDYRTWENPTTVLTEALMRFVPASGGKPRLIVFADSFERAERLDEVVAFNVGQAVEALRLAGADVMAIYAGRAFRDPDGLDPQHRPAVQHVRRFSQGEAVDFLIAKARQRGVRLQRRHADRANRTLNGWPLGLRIAVSMFGTSPETFDPAAWLAAIETDGRSVHATLYERLLNRIEDPNLKKLAMPGLLLRRLTGPVIEQVLAGPCKLRPDVDGDAMLSRAQLEGQLFSRDLTDPGALWHRQDLREVMLPVLRQQVDAATTRTIHDLAVAYYSSQSDDIARAEELYHRLCRGDGADKIAPRWQPAAGQRLINALAELPPQAASILRQLLGGGLSRPSGADGAARIEELRSVARNRLADGATDVSDLFSQAGVPEQIRSPLGDIWAEVLARLGHYEEVIDAAEDVSGAFDVPQPVQARVAITAAGLAEGLQDQPRALRLWRAALRLKRHLQPPELLTVRIAVTRLLRKTNALPSTRSYHATTARALLEQTVSAVRSNRVLRLEAVAELSDILRLGTNPRPVNPGRQSRATLVSLFREISPMFPSASGSRPRLDDIARRLGQDPASINTPFELDRIAVTLFASPAPGQHDMALDALRSEVDHAFAAVVGRDLSGMAPDGPESPAHSAARPSIDYA